MQPLHLPTGYSAMPKAAGDPRRRIPARTLGMVGKGLAAFFVGLVIGVSTILIAELVTAPPSVPAGIEDGPLQLKR